MALKGWTSQKSVQWRFLTPPRMLSNMHLHSGTVVCYLEAALALLKGPLSQHTGNRGAYSTGCCDRGPAATQQLHPLNKWKYTVIKRKRMPNSLLRNVALLL